MPAPVIIDTDIGGDIDDSWALTMALRSPELDIRLVTTSTGDAAYRARVAAHLLAAAGRDDIPIGIGVGGTGSPAKPLETIASDVSLDSYAAWRGRGGRRHRLDDRRRRRAGDGHRARAAVDARCLLDAHPRIVHRTRLVGMQGSYRVGYRGAAGPVPEYNVAADVSAARRVFAAEWHQTFTPLDTCGSVLLRDDRYRAVKRAAAADDAVLGALFRQQRVWLESAGRPELLDRRTTTLFDTVAIYLAYDESFVQIEEAQVSVDDDGTMRPAADGPAIRFAVGWHDKEAFLAHLTTRLLGTPTP